jgi:septum formation protein
MDDIANQQYTLASQSPRRQSLFKVISPNFEIRVKEVEEIYPPTLPYNEVPEFLAKLKAEAFKDDRQISDRIFITADTIVAFDNKVLGKPKDEQNAIEMLQNLRGNFHEVITGVCISRGDEIISFSNTSKVYFDNISDNRIINYVKNEQPLDKAGSYGIQESIGMIGIRKIEGCYYNIMGLPVNQLYNELKTFIRR